MENGQWTSDVCTNLHDVYNVLSRLHNISISSLHVDECFYYS